jgi:hypothetical protein
MRPQRVGTYRQRLALYDVPETSQDSYGQPSLAGSLIGTFWGSCDQLKGQEQLNVRAVWPTATHLVKLRWLGSMIPSSMGNPSGLIIPRMKFILTKSSALVGVFGILAAQNVEERNRQWVCTCEEHVGAIA